MRGRLWGMRAYLCGAMDSATDGGIGWRRKAAQWLEARGCVPFDPTDKPINLGGETPADRQRRHQLMEAGRLDELSAEIKLLRAIDLRMVDITDFTIVALDRTHFPCGTYEELFLANREKKPVLVCSAQEPKFTSLWLYGTLPHQHIFHEWSDLFDYLEHINTAAEVDRLNRWYFFDTDRLYQILKTQDAPAL